MGRLTSACVLACLTATTLACVDNDDDSGSEAADDASESGAGACDPGMVSDCACADGTPGEQVCKAAGDGYWPCECGNAEASASQTAGSQSGSQSTTASETGDATASDASTGASECESSHPLVDGEMRYCEADACYCKPTDACFAADQAQGCCTDAVVCGGASCQGMHPLVEGDMRYCETGFCYCGDPTADPAVDACYPADAADGCCPVEVVCY